MFTSNGYVLREDSTRLGRLQPTPVEERADHAALWSRLRRDGYLYLTNHLDPGEVWEFRRYYFEALSRAGVIRSGSDPLEGFAGDGNIDRGEYRRILFDEIVPGARYEALCRSPRIAEWFGWLFEDDVHLHRRKIIRHTQPGERGVGTATQAHYDLVYLREGSDRVLSMWIPLGDTPISRGGLAYLEGSHHRVMAQERAGTLRHPAASITADLPGLADEYDTRWLLADYAAGDVVVHSAHIVHAGLDNVDQTGRMRLSTDIRYQRVSDPIDWRWKDHWHEDDGL
ncbi:phytanoyl-CoA dioxygenase family protein [Microbacterium oxydans]|uniref:phytanoyl-CoA dioxygenase family protein n=1 Tax=Microbacterium oxydans TaxID=82380 RepID=UPI003672FD8E